MIDLPAAAHEAVRVYLSPTRTPEALRAAMAALQAALALPAHTPCPDCDGTGAIRVYETRLTHGGTCGRYVHVCRCSSCQGTGRRLNSLD